MHAANLDELTSDPAPTVEETPLPPLAASAMGDASETARALAQQHGLVRGGEYFCWDCGSSYEFHVTLHCVDCRHDHRRTHREEVRRERRMSDEEYRWRGMCRNMATDSRMTSELAVTLLMNARKLPSAPKFVETLEATYRARFGNVDPKRKQAIEGGFET